MKPSRASEIAGCSRSFHGIRPLSVQAMFRPATVPGTPTERWLSWWSSELYFPSFMNIVGVAAAGACSRKS